MQTLDVRALRKLLATTALGTSVAFGGAAIGSAWAQTASEAAPPPQSTEAAPPASPEKSEAPAAREAEKAAQPTAANEPPAAPQPAQVANNPVLDEIRRQLSEQRSGGGDTAVLAAFYAERSGSPVWVTESGFSARAENAMAEIAKADDWGLVASQFELPKLAPGATDARALATAEIRLATAVLKYARHARGGRIDPLQLSPNLDQKLALRDPAEVLKAVAATETPSTYLLSLHPQHEQFQKLRASLIKARSGDTAPEAPQPEFVVLPDGPQIKSGSKHANVPLLRKRLGLEARPDDLIFDAELSEALKMFQRDKGLQASGQLTAKTRQVLNAGAPKPAVKPASQVGKLIANMERWRWMPENMGAFHVWQNTPEYTVRVVKNDAVVHQARVVVGKLGTQTPVFSARMQYVVFNPEWGVPDSIKVKEILPYLRPAQDDLFGSLFGGAFGGADTRVLQKHNLRVSYNGKVVDASTVNWGQVDIRRYTFIQPAGGTNVLGVVKFRFPNKHDVYMHDTPQRDLFAKEVRAFSHGCVRVQNPLKLAEVLLAEDKGWGPQQIQSALVGAGPNEIELTNRIPVHLSYFTAVAGPDGQISFFDDLYGHDARVSAALAGRTPAPDVVADASDTPPTKGKKGKKRPITDDLW